MSDVKLPDNWEMKKIAEVAETTGGYGFPKRFQGRTDLPFPFVKVSDMNIAGNETYIRTAANTVDANILDEIRARAYPPGTIIFPKIGGAIATNKKRILGVEASFDNNIMAIIPNESRVLVKWCFHYLQSIDLMQMANVGPVPSIRQSTVQDYLIPLPYPDEPARSLAEQRRIVARIEALLAEVGEMRKLQAEIAEDTERLFKAFAREVFDEIDHTWARTRLATHTLKIGSGSTPRGGRAVYKQSGIPLIRSLNVRWNTFNDADLAFIDNETHERMSSSTVLPGDVLLNITGASIGRACRVPDDICPANVNQHVSIIRPDESLQSEFVMYWLTSPGMQSYINANQAGATRQALTKSQIEDFMIPFADKTMQLAVVEYLNHARIAIEESIEGSQSDLMLLEQLEQAILAQAFRGEL